MSSKLTPVKPHGMTCAGIDGYHGDENSVWDSHLASPLVRFAFHKATEGVTMQDTMLGKRWQAMVASGKVIGVYLFFHPSLDPVKQANYFHEWVTKQCGTLRKQDLIWLDWESTDKTPSATDCANALKCLQEIQRLFGKKPGIYSGPYFLSVLNCPAELATYDLWVAEYGPAQPLIPAPWTDWKFWQYDSDIIDVSYFNGSPADLVAYASGGAAKAEEPETLELGHAMEVSDVG